MSRRYGDFADDFYVNFHLNTEMELPAQRETVLGFFERLRKDFPGMRNFYSREKDEFVLEEDKSEGSYRWATVDPKRICAGFVNPPSLEEASLQHLTIVDLLPYFLSVSPLDCESFSVMFGFDFTYAGNHNALVAEALGLPPAFEKMLDSHSGQLVAYEPAIQFAIDEDCRTQIRVSIETRTGAYQMRSGEYSDEQFSVFLTARHFGSLPDTSTYLELYRGLLARCERLMDDYVVDQILVPLQQAIAIR